MISTVVRDCATSTQNFLYSWQDEKNWTLTRFIATPLTTLTDVVIESVTPLLQTIESVVFGAISLIAIAYYIVTLNPKEAGKATKMTLINLNEAIINVLRFVGKSALSPFNFIGQTWLTISDHPTAKPSSKNFCGFDLSPPGSRIASEFRAGIPFGTKLSLQPYAAKFICYLFQGENNLGKKHPIFSRIMAIPLVAIDTAASIAMPLIATIDTIVKLVMTIFLAPFHSSEDRKELKKLFFSGVNYLVDCLAHAISMIALSPITLVGQAVKTIIYDPASAGPSMFSLYGFCMSDDLKSADQSYLTTKGMTKAKAECSFFGTLLYLEKAVTPT